MDPSIEVGVVMKQLFSRNSVDCDVARNAPRNYRADQQGSVAMFFALSIIPIMGLIAFGIDYSRENAVKAKVYAAVDAAALSATSMALNGASAIAEAQERVREMQPRTSLAPLRMCRSKCLEISSHTLTPRTLLPCASSRGENVPSPNWAGKEAMMPPPTPLFAGMPTR